MNTYIVDAFVALKYPERHEEQLESLRKALAGMGIRSETDAKQAESDRHAAKLKVLEKANNEAGEMLGFSIEDLIRFQETRSAQRRESGENHHAKAMKVAAAAFLEAEQRGLLAREAVDAAEHAMGQEFASGRESQIDRKTLGAWLRSLQDFGVTKIPRATKGRPKKE